MAARSPVFGGDGVLAGRAGLASKRPPTATTSPAVVQPYTAAHHAMVRLGLKS